MTLLIALRSRSALSTSTPNLRASWSRRWLPSRVHCSYLAAALRSTWIRAPSSRRALRPRTRA